MENFNLFDIHIVIQSLFDVEVFYGISLGHIIVILALIGALIYNGIL